MNAPRALAREVGLPGAVLLGLGSILGTGVFVSIGVGAGLAGPGVLLAIALAACVATANGLSSAQLAASHPVSGGTYEYGYQYVSPAAGYAAGWMFLCAKSASAATAALGFAGYLLEALGAPAETWLVPLAIGGTVVLTAIVLSGMRRSNTANAVIVLATIGALLTFVLAGAFAGRTDGARFRPFFGDGGPMGLLHATAILFVAYTGYGRIATLGEEVRAPKRTIPRAILLTLGLSAALYLAVGAVAVGVAGPEAFAAATSATAAPLEVLARGFEAGPAIGPAIGPVLAAGAVTAMLGVLLNLLLGLSRVLLAMGRRADLPRGLARLDGRADAATPRIAVLTAGGVVAALAATGDVRTTWSFSAFTVLLYYALTNLAALRLPAADRRYPPWIAAAGLVACLLLAFCVEPKIWLTGLAVLGGGFLVRAMVHRFGGGGGVSSSRE